MLNLNDLNSYVIYDDTKKYDKINQIIIEEAKNYYKTMKNHSYQITQIENKLNEYNIKSHIITKATKYNKRISKYYQSSFIFLYNS